MMYFFPILFGSIGLWPILGACIFLCIDNRNDVFLYDFVKANKSKYVSDHHLFIWPYVVWIWFKFLKEIK